MDHFQKEKKHGALRCPLSRTFRNDLLSAAR
jgi:hypothetical protein